MEPSHKHKTQVVGILNVTPDSYFDGGKHVTDEAIATRALELAAQGADIIEIGGESTGPGSPEVSLQEEQKRVIVALESIRKVLPDHPLALDTYKSGVLSAAAKYGISMVNDVTAGRGDPELFALTAGLGIDIVLMHAKDSTPRTTREDAHYADVVSHVHSFLLERVEIALQAGVQPEKIILDPGLGHFVSADAKYSFELLLHLKEATDPYRSFVSPSRKSFLAGRDNLPAKDRLPATLGATAIAIEHDASFIRTHDVEETKRVIDAFTLSV